jgi:hypothetical protein
MKLRTTELALGIFVLLFFAWLGVWYKVPEKHVLRLVSIAIILSITTSLMWRLAIIGWCKLRKVIKN